MRTRLVLRMVVIVVISSMAIGVITAGAQYFSHRRSKYEMQFTLARSAAETVDIFFEQPQTLITEFGYRVTAGENPGEALQNIGPGVIQRYNYVDTLLLLDGELRVVASTSPVRYPQGYDMTGYQRLVQGVPVGDTRMSLAGFMADDGSPQLVMAHRLHEGYMLGYFRLDVITDIMQEIVVSENTSIALIDDHGVYAVHTDFARVQERQQESLFSDLYTGNGFQPAQKTVRRDYEDILVSVYPVQNGRWAVITYEKMSRLVYQLLQSLFYGLLVLGLAIILIGFFSYRSLKAAVIPLERITRRLQLVANGNYRQQISYQGYAEIEFIVEAFNRMALNILESQQRLTKEIEDRKLAEQVLQGLVEEKDALLQELHHRVKNNLQIMSSLLNLQLMRINDDNLKLLLQGVRLKLISLSMVHERIYVSSSLSQIAMAEFLRDLIAVVRNELKPAGLDLSIMYNMDSVYLQVDKATTASILLNELLSNAVLHAFNGRSSGMVRVAMHRYGDQLEIQVSDDGVGMPAGLDPYNPQTLGLTLVQSLAAQLFGTVLFEDTSPGVTVILRFPIEHDSMN
ncbi:MAG: sensor histidine kinase [Spirochaeta sp.]